MIRVEGLHKSYGRTVALAGVSFGVARGEVVGLLGPNGAGKTTCLRILTSFVAPEAGDVRINGLDPARESLSTRRLIGYLPENAPIYPELRVREYLGFRARLRRIGPRARRAAIDEVVQSCGLDRVTGRLVGQLSRGFRQRLGLADALLGRPPVLILDEPTAGLDPNQIREVRRLIRELVASGDHTVLLSTHVLGEVEAICSRAVILHRGGLVGDAAVEDLRERPGEGVIALQVRIRDTAADADSLIAALRQLPFCARVERVEPPRSSRDPQPAEVVHCRLHGEAGPEAREQLAALIGSHPGWVLQSLAAERPDLEEVFARLTTDDEEPG